MKVKYTFVSHIRMVVGSGARALFGEDVWLGKRKLVDIFPRLYSITFTKWLKILVGSVSFSRESYMVIIWLGGKS